MDIGEVLDILENARGDTEFSKDIFNSYEEGMQDDDLRKGRRDWLIIADIYNDRNYTQKFHLKNYLHFKLEDGLCRKDNFENRCYRYFNNSALILYTREIIFNEKKRR